MMDADNDDITEAGAANIGFVPHRTTGQDRSGSLLMDHLPREILTQSVLSRYLDGSDLANFWCATMSMREMVVRRHSPRKLRNQRNSPLSMVEEILRIIRYRKALITEGETNDDREDGGGGENDHSCRLRRMVFQAFEEAAATESGEASADTNAGASDREQRPSEHEHFCWKEFLRLSRRTFATLSAMDYCERVPHNLVWTGHLSVRNSNNQDQNQNQNQYNDNPILVILVADPRRWSMKEVRLWRNATTISCGSGFASFRSSEAGSDSNSKSNSKSNPKPTIRADVVPHNFLPLGPNRGRLVGATPADREKLGTLSQELNRTGMVARFSCTIPHASGSSNRDRDSNTTIADTNLESRNRGGQFTAKLVAFDQAQDRLDAVFRRDSEPGGILLRDEQKAMRLAAWHAVGNSNGESDGHSETHSRNLDRCSLLCCWNHEFLWEDSRSFRMETSHALMDSMREYAFTQSEMWLTETTDD